MGFVICLYPFGVTKGTEKLSWVNLTHWGRVTHICVSKLTIIGSDNGLSPGRRQAIIWTNAGILLIGPLGTNFKWNFNRNSYIFIQENLFENVVWKIESIFHGLNVLISVDDLAYPQFSSLSRGNLISSKVSRQASARFHKLPICWQTKNNPYVRTPVSIFTNDKSFPTNILLSTYQNRNYYLGATFTNTD